MRATWMADFVNEAQIKAPIIVKGAIQPRRAEVGMVRLAHWNLSRNTTGEEGPGLLLTSSQSPSILVFASSPK